MRRPREAISLLGPARKEGREGVVQLFRQIGTSWTRRIVLTEKVFGSDIRGLVRDGKISAADVDKVHTHKKALKWLTNEGYISPSGRVPGGVSYPLRIYWGYSDKERREILKEAKRKPRRRPRREIPPPVEPRRAPMRIIERGEHTARPPRRPIAPEFPSSVMLRFVGGRSDKFYEISHRGNLVYLRWGRFGTEGTRRTKEFGSFKEALKFHNKQIKSKLRKGYWMD